jgi:hypothetical protein
MTPSVADLVVTMSISPAISGSYDMGNGVAEIPGTPYQPPVLGEDGVTIVTPEVPEVPAVPAVPAAVVASDESGNASFTYAAYGTYTITFTPADGNPVVALAVDVPAPPPPPAV